MIHFGSNFFSMRCEENTMQLKSQVKKDFVSQQENQTGNVEFAAITYRTIRDRIRAEDPYIDEQTLADTVDGLTDVHDIIAAIIRAALADEALATGLKGRIAEMQDRLARLQDCAAKRRQIAKDVMVELDLKKITARS